MDDRHPGVQHNETALDVHAERGRRIAATLNTHLTQLCGEPLRSLRPRTCYKDGPPGLLVRARDTLQRSALPCSCLTDHDDQPLLRTRHPDRTLLLSRERTATLRDGGGKQSDLAGDERVVDNFATDRRELVGATQRRALERAMLARCLPSIREIEH